MDAIIKPSAISGTIFVPPSKSYTHRAIILASLAQGVSEIRSPLFSDDTKATISACKSLGAAIDEKGGNLFVKGTGGNLQSANTTINCLSSGTTIRLLTAVAAIAQGSVILTGSRRLCERPIEGIVNAIRKLGATVAYLRKEGFAPIRITGTDRKVEKVEVDSQTSSQYLSALLLVAPYFSNGLTIVVKGKGPSKPYVDMTIVAMQKFGIQVLHRTDDGVFTVGEGNYKATIYEVEGDYTQASYFIGAALITNGHVTLENLNKDSVQGDRHFLAIIQSMGGMIEWKENTLNISPNKLHGMDVDMGNYPDIVQTLAAIAASATGETRITNISHLHGKESDRIEDTAGEMRKMGIEVETSSSSMNIYGGSPHGATIDTHNDHRIAMSMAILALAADGETTIKRAEMVEKSYPNFWEDLASLGANITLHQEEGDY